MRTALIIAAALLCSLPAAFAQNTTVRTIRTNTQLVMVDVIVLGKDNKPIHGLPKSAFTVREDKKPQTIIDFEEHHAGTPQNTLESPKLPHGVFTNYHPVNTDAPLNIVLIDTLNTPLKDQMYVRQQIKDYVNHAPAGARIAVFGLSSHLYFLQGFTSDPTMLKRAISGGKEARQSPIVGTSDMQDISAPATDMLIQGSVNDYADLFAKEEVAARNQARAQYTLDGLNVLARYLAGFPGRKNLVWFSGSFPINILPNQNDMSDPFTIYGDLGDEYRDTVNLMTKAQVAVYPVDARGVFGANVLRADQGSFTTGSQLQGQIGAFHEQTGAEHATMQQMADDTGGRVFMNTNALSAAVRDAIADGSDFYTVTYSPTNKDTDGLFRTIEVNVNGGYKIRHRQGYYSPTKDEVKAAAKNPQANTRLSRGAAAMTLGAPSPTEIYLNMQIVPLGTQTGGAQTSTLAAGNWIESKVKPPYRNYNIVVSADPQQMSAKLLPDGRRQMDIEIVTMVYDSDGKQLTSVTNQLHGALDPQTYSDLFKHGVSITQQISVPAKDGKYFRTGVHDLNNDRMGAVEVPVALASGLSAKAQ